MCIKDKKIPKVKNKDNFKASKKGFPTLVTFRVFSN